MTATPGAIEGAPVVPEAPPPAAAPVEAKVTGPAAEQADALATAAASAGSPDKQLGVLAAGAQKVLKFIRGSALSDAQLQNIKDTAPERAALAESLKPPLEKQPMPDGLAPATGPLAKEVAEKAASSAPAEGESPKVDGLPDPFDGKSVGSESAGESPKDTVAPASEPVVGDTAAGPTPASEEGSVPAGAPIATEVASASPEPTLGEKAFTEINGLLGDGILTKDSKAEDLMKQLVAKGWKNDADTLNYVQGAIDTARAKTPVEQAPASSESQSESTTAESEQDTASEVSGSEQADQKVTKLEGQLQAANEKIDKLSNKVDELIKMQLEQAEIMKIEDLQERLKRIAKLIAKLTAIAAGSAFLQVTEEAGETVTGQQQR